MTRAGGVITQEDAADGEVCFCILLSCRCMDDKDNMIVCITSEVGAGIAAAATEAEGVTAFEEKADDELTLHLLTRVTCNEAHGNKAE